jgi:hypothetical protein
VFVLKKSYFILFSMLLLISTVSPVLGQMMSGIGVAKDQTFSYSYKCYFLSNDSSVTPPPEFSWINQTDYYMMNITSISGSNIGYETTMRMLNGSVNTGTGSMNMGNGLNMMSGYNPMSMNGYYFMASNVGMMGRMYTSSNTLTINDTFMMNYAGAQRQTNHMSIINSQNGKTNQSDYYFDQATGAMVEWRQQYIQTNGDLQANSTQVMKIMASSVWTIPEFPAYLMIPFLCAATVLVIGIKLRKKPLLHLLF